MRPLRRSTTSTGKTPPRKGELNQDFVGVCCPKCLGNGNGSCFEKVRAGLDFELADSQAKADEHQRACRLFQRMDREASLMKFIYSYGSRFVRIHFEIMRI